MITLDDFIPQEDPAHEESVPLNPLVPVIRNWPLVLMMIREAFVKQPERVQLLLDSNGSLDKHATQWQLRRVIS